MARFLIVTLPFVGHVGAALPISRKLIANGHAVWWYSGKKYQNKIEATGATFTPFKAALDFDDADLDATFPKPENTKSSLAKLKFGLKHTFIDSSFGQVEDLKNILQIFPADVILADLTAFSVGWLHEMGGPAWVALNHTPPTFSSRDVPPFGLNMLPDASFKGRLRNITLHKLMNRVIFRDVVVYLNKVRARLGLPPEKRNLMDTVQSPYLILQGTVPSFEYPRSDLPPQVRFIGSFLPEPPHNFVPPLWWSELLTSKRPVIHVTQGTVATDSSQLLIPTLQALAAEEVLVVATTGGPPVETVKMNPLPSNVRLESFIPHYYLLPNVNVMITNGGYNGVQIALANGVPLVGAGASEDKPEVCNRIGWSGAGINLKTATPSPDQIRQAVREILANPTYKQKAGRIQAEMAHYNAATMAVEWLEQVALTKRPVTENTPKHLLAHPIGNDQSTISA